ncbi:MAG TPA: hypothetical protein VK826_02080 [Bacteroidia bacterium]|nr:hypothetical protein [Bacteroidia bacterium]
MAKKSYIEIEIDRLTNSIENSVSGDKFDTEIIRLSKEDLKKLKKKDWLFDWNSESKQKERLVFKLVIQGNQDVIQGLVSLSVERDHVYMHLIESAKFNKGKEKIYVGAPGNLVAFACNYSLEKGHEGFVAFDAKTTLIKHYEETLFATHFKGSRMYIDNIAAQKLIDHYFKK